MRRFNALILLLCSITPTFANAGFWEERAILERYITQLEALNNNLLMDAKRAADPTVRIQLNYDAVLAEQEHIILKLKNHLNTPLRDVNSSLERGVDNNAD